jgi:Protein of unknown function (DUF2934)
MNNDSARRFLDDMQYAINSTPYSEGCLVTLIHARAYELFEGRGVYPGHALDDWVQAEQEIKHHLGLL